MSRNSLKNIAKLIKESSENLPIEKQFLNDLKKSIELTNLKESRKPSQTYKPSSMNCIRNMYYQVIGAEQGGDRSSYALIGICNSGTDIHERIQQSINGMAENEFECEYIDVGEYVKSRNLVDIEVVEKKGMETKLYYKSLNMSFLCDGIIKYKGKYYIVEIKTETSYKWNVRTGVDPVHYNQAISYSNAFGINGVIFIYINRDNLDMKAYLFNVTDEMKKELVDKIKLCDSYVERKQVPPKQDNLYKKTCLYCSYRNQCERDG